MAKVGKPKKTPADFPQFFADKHGIHVLKDIEEIDGEHKILDWKEMILLEMSHGASLEEIKALLSVADSTHVRLMKEEKEYSKTVKEGIKLSKAWWLRNGRVNLYNKEFSYVGWYMNMKNRFGWRDKQEVEQTGDSTVKIQFVADEQAKSNE